MSTCAELRLGRSAPVIYVKGRQHEVTVMYADEAQEDYQEAALKTIFNIHLKLPPGDILVFLPGSSVVSASRAVHR